MRDAIGLPAARADKLAFLQAFKDGQCAVGEDMAVTGEADDFRHLATLSARKVDGPTLSQHVQHALFMFGDVHWSFGLLELQGASNSARQHAPCGRGCLSGVP